MLEDTRVLQTQWSLYLPAGYRYVDFAGPMREVYDGRGWNWLRAHLDPFVPALGPDAAQVTTAEWQDPPALPAATGGGFDSPVPKEGTPVVLRRLDAPAPVEVSFRSLGYANTVEALAFFLALAGGLALLGSSRGPRLAYFFIVGIGALILAGAVAPRASGLWTAVYLGRLPVGAVSGWRPAPGVGCAASATGCASSAAACGFRPRRSRLPPLLRPTPAAFRAARPGRLDLTRRHAFPCFRFWRLLALVCFISWVMPAPMIRRQRCNTCD